MKTITKINDDMKHYVYREIGLIKGYKLTNETNENENIVVNDIKIEINLSSISGAEFYDQIKDKFKPENLKPKYATSANYVYSEYQEEDLFYINIKILTNKSNKKEVIAKKKLLYRINKYT